MSLSIKEAQDGKTYDYAYEKPKENGVTLGEMFGDLFDKK